MNGAPLLSAVAAFAMTVSASARCEVIRVEDCGGRVLRAHLQGVAAPGEFVSAFCDAVGKVEGRLVEWQWYSAPSPIPSTGVLRFLGWFWGPRSIFCRLGLLFSPAGIFGRPCADFEVYVREMDSCCEVSQALEPAYHGRRGEITFPSRWVIDRVAPYVHELVHVYFPNGKRMLAEGIAEYMEYRFGTPPPDWDATSYPRCHLHQEALPLAWAIRIADEAALRVGTSRRRRAPDAPGVTGLDSIFTPEDLEQGFFLEDKTYPVAGSFVQFLVEDLKFADIAMPAPIGIDGDAFRRTLFLALYNVTPLNPFHPNESSEDRWEEIYNVTLKQLQTVWRECLEGGCFADCEPSLIPLGSDL
jgi:hypothetical protein